jgi:hypothetical protein
MTRGTTTCIAILLLLAPFMTAQEPRETPKIQNSSFPADVIPAQQLIAWSWMQKPQPEPQPAPQPTPPPDRTLSQPGSQPESSNLQAAQSPKNQDVTGK